VGCQGHRQTADEDQVGQFLQKSKEVKDVRGYELSQEHGVFCNKGGELDEYIG
jgi:hypothetical protein